MADNAGHKQQTTADTPDGEPKAPDGAPARDKENVVPPPDASVSRSGSPAPDLLKAYEEYSKTLRTWFVAYGIGAPVLFLTNDSLAGKLLMSKSASLIAGLFLGGVAAQVFLAALNKTVMWACYYGAVTPSYQSKGRYRFAGWISEQYAIDFLLDLATVALFVIATEKTFRILIAAG